MYWFKILSTDENKYIKMVYKLILSDLDRFPNKENSVSLVRNSLMSLGFNNVWLGQGWVTLRGLFLSLY